MLLLFANGELTLRLLVGVCKSLESTHGLTLKDRKGEFNVGFGVFMSRLYRWGVRGYSSRAWSKDTGSLQKRAYHRGETQEWRSTLRASPRLYPQRIYHSLPHHICQLPCFGPSA